MSTIRTIAAVAACKAARWTLRLLHRGGTALPGKVAMKFDPEVLRTVSRGMKILVVTGTNGKTTTCRMLEHALTRSGVRCLANKSGANLLSGVTAEFVCNADWLGRPKTEYAVVECDEGALRQVVPLLSPEVITVTNLFRDQLDRYGEVMHTLEAVRTGVKTVPETTLCLNADCSLTSSISLDVPNPVRYFGLDVPVGEQKETEISDARHCIRCGTAYEYKYYTYAHLGGFYCPKCGYSRHDADVAVTQISSVSAAGSQVRMRWPGGERDTSISLPAVFNIYNAAAAVCAFTSFAGQLREKYGTQLDPEMVFDALSDVESSFGRMENFDLDGVPVQMILVKNPAGCSQSISYLTQLNQDYTLAACLNDRTADGHDISWIWDADYEKLSEDPHLKQVLVCGDRAEDLQLRLKYAGVPEERIELVPDFASMLEKMRSSKRPVFAMPNYTSMLELRGLLSQATGKKAFWK
ncbi:MAG: DUF1727 domain-containing protein [Lachnospiraceae bacterium]|nr:DUF1727 domain-containing protein [Lachnospiraceae bacterium]